MFGYIKGDCFWHIKHEFETLYKLFPKVVCLNKFKWPELEYPLEWFTKEQILKDYYLIVSRLVPYKKVDLAIKVFNKLGLPLVIVGSGSEEKKLKSIAKPNIKFIGYLTDKVLSNYYKRCTAFLLPQEEDFGLAAVEAQANGTPVIAYQKGGALDIVVEKKTGVFFTAQTVESLTDAIEKFARMKFSQQDCLENAAKFSKERFKLNFKSLLKNFCLV